MHCCGRDERAGDAIQSVQHPRSGGQCDATDKATTYYSPGPGGSFSTPRTWPGCSRVRWRRAAWPSANRRMGSNRLRLPKKSHSGRGRCMKRTAAWPTWLSKKARSVSARLSLASRSALASCRDFVMTGGLSLDCQSSHSSWLIVASTATTPPHPGWRQRNAAI